MRIAFIGSLAAFILLVVPPAFGQAQSKFPLKYEGTVLDQRGLPLKNADITLRGTIYLGQVGGPIAYQETRVAKSDAYGNFNADFGRGKRVAGQASSIDMKQNRYFFMVEMQSEGRSDFALAYARPILAEREEINIVQSAPPPAPRNNAAGSVESVRVVDGSVYLDSNTKSVIMTSPNGQCWRLMVTNTGDLITQAIQCPN